MGALALPIPWIPEDDLLLKNAVEAGASLESLAKGAVEFSRRFTIKELQDRWHAILYNPTDSMRAAIQMVELERERSASNVLSKSNRADNSKGNKVSLGKRKDVRTSYYASKRVCSEPRKHGDISFLIAPGDNCFINGDEAPVPDNMLGDPMVNHFGLDHDDFNLHHVFPQVMLDGDQPIAVGEFPIEQHNTLEDHMQQDTMLANTMDIKEIPGHNMFEGTGIQENPVCDSKDILCSGYLGTTIFNTPMSDCENALRHLQYTSTPPAMPDWKTMQGISVPEMPDDVGIRGENVQIGDQFATNDADAGTADYDDMCTRTGVPCDDFKNPTGCPEEYLAELDSLFHYGSDDGEKGVTHKKYYDGLCSLLLNSPNHVNEDRLPNALEAKKPPYADEYIVNRSSAGQDDLANTNLQNFSDSLMPTSAACITSEFPEYRNGAICCQLNTEDEDIPCNDDIVFPSKPRPASVNRRTQSEANNPSIHGKDNTGTSGKGFSTMKREPKRFGESHPASQTRVPDVGMNRVGGELGVKIETSNAETLNGPRITSSGYGGPCQSNQAVKKEPSEVPLARQPGCSAAEKLGQISDLGHLHTAVGGTNEEAQTPSTLRYPELHAGGPMDDMLAELVGEPLLSDPEEQFSESDTDIPYFSDVESMILDMDLGPEDQDFFCTREVAKYQHEDVKRAIIRLEQNAHSYMQRDIASRGAFAVLCGRHSKHYIKKSEVLIGRGTDEVNVDIDLGREGRANKISRKQAIIKMDKDGSFIIKNNGKCSIYVNSKEIFSSHSLVLQSNCLVEIREMPFLFVTNQARIKQYLDNAARKLEEKRLNS